MKQLVIKSILLAKFSGLVHGVSTKISTHNESSFDLGNFNSINNDQIRENRKLFFESIGVDHNSVVFQKQIHSSNFCIAEDAGLIENNDALISKKKNLFLVVTIADCIPILFYDEKNKIIGAVHSGWRGTVVKILKETVQYAIDNLNLDIKSTYFYFGPSICKNCFEVDQDVADKFDSIYLKKQGKKFLVDLPKVNLDQLIELGAKKQNIQISNLCTFELDNVFHSYRRDKQNAGRMFAVIGLRK